MSNRVYKAVVLLTVFSMIDRTLGFVFKIFLSRTLGATALGIYQVSLSVFFLLLTLTTSGTPLIVSKLTAKFRAKNDLLSEHKTVTSALIVGLCVSVLACIIIIILQKPLKSLFAADESMTLLFFLLPGIVFSGIYAGFRGSMWGSEKYLTVSAIELIEQIIRILLCVLLFYLGLNKLKMTAISMSVACGFTAIACMLSFFKQKGRLKNPKGHIIPLIKQSAPITVIRASNSLVGSLVAITVPFLLKLQGMSSAEALNIYGTSVGMALPLLYIPITVVGSLAYVLIPTLSTALAKNDLASVRRQIENAITFAIIASALFVPIFFILGKPIGIFVYNNEQSGDFLSKSAWLLLPVAIENITSSMMNSLDLEKSSFFNYSLGSLVLFAILFSFTRAFKIEILIYAMATSLTISSVLDIRKIAKKTGIKLSFVPPLIKCGIIAIPTMFLIKCTDSLLKSLPQMLSLSISCTIGLSFFVMLCLVFDVFDFSILFKGSKTKQPKTSKKIKHAQNGCKKI